MNQAQALARLAGLLADRTRAGFCLALLDGRAWTMGELARHAGVTGSTASEQLSRLVDAGLLVEERQGRHRYLRLAGPEVARMIEDLTGHATAPGRPGADPETGRTGLRSVRVTRELAAGRTCYDHLAGRLGVGLAGALAGQGLVDLTAGVTLTPAGATWLTGLDVDVDRLRAARRPLLRTCLDWTERRPHLAGGVGAALRQTFLARAWLEPGPTPRTIRVTARGRAEQPLLAALSPESPR